MRVEPNSVRGGEQIGVQSAQSGVRDFSDMPNVDVESGHHVNQPLIKLIDRLLGPDDLIAVMTPEMAASQVTFGRKTEVIAGMLEDHGTGGSRTCEQRRTNASGSTSLLLADGGRAASGQDPGGRSSRR